MTGGYERADEAAHARSREHVRADVELLEHPPDPDVAQPARSSAAQGEAQPTRGPFVMHHRPSVPRT